MLKTTIGHSTVQQRLRDKGRRHSGNVVGNPGLHVSAGALHVFTLKQHLVILQKQIQEILLKQATRASMILFIHTETYKE